MTNASLTTIKQEYDLTTESGLIRLAQDAGRDYKKKMLIVVEYWLKPVSEGGQGKKIEELASKINKNEKTLRNHYVAPLRKEGRLPAATQGNRSKPKCPPTGTSVENLSTPLTTTTFSQSTDDNVPERLQPLNTMGCDRDGVPTIQPEVVSEDEERNVRLESMGTKQDRSANEDWQQFQYHLESLRELHRRNFRPDSSGLTEGQWSDLSGEYEELKYFADLRWQRLREELEQGRREFNEFTDHAAKAIGEQSSCTDS